MYFKRFLCIALGLFMLASCGCVGVDEGSLESSAPDESKTDEESVGEESIPVINTVATEYTKTIDKLLSGTSDRTLNSMNLLKGVSYKSTVSASAEYPDNKKLLTDGVYPDKFATDGTWVGYKGSRGSKNIITFDLGSLRGGFLDFSVTALELTDYGIDAPESIKFYVAGRDEKYVAIGTAYRPDGTLDQNAVMDYRISLRNALEARYIRLEIISKNTWLFLGEVSAWSYDKLYTTSNDTIYDINAYYGYKEIPEIKTPEYWDKKDKDYKTETNLVKSKKPYIYAEEAVEPELINAWYNGTDTQKLTDGIIATNPSYAAEQWFHITQGYTRSITFDLKKTSAVKGFTVGFLRDSGAGVQMPSALEFFVSENGRDWQRLYFLDNLVAENAYDIVRVEEAFEKTHKARYVRVSFCVYSHAYVDEITVIGTKDISGALDVIPDKAEDTDGGEYLMPDDFYGVNNMLLSYHCSLDENNVSGEGGRVDVDEYLPYLAYIDKDGKIKDTFFDSVLYLPYVNMLHDAKKSLYGRSADGWRNYLDDMFYPDRNMNALEKCADKVYSELGITDQKIKVFTSILYTFPKHLDGSKNNFGDIDGDGKKEDFSKIDDRKKAIKWIMDEEYKRFNAGGYKNLEFCGYYWFEEAIDYSDPHEKELIRFAVDYAHTLGLKVFWIPYRNAAGVDDWESLGFDAACLQPNYMFNANGNPSALYNTAKRAKRLGMCVELEISDAENRTDARKFIEYLNAGAETGYMDGVKMYYQNGVPGAFYYACYSKNEYARFVYDNTYLFAKGKYKPILPEDNVISDSPISFVCKTGKTLKGQLDLSGLNTAFGHLKITLSPKYGSVRLNSDGSFTYYPAEGYKGVDSFCVAYDIGYGEPASTEIIIVCE